jgi:tRNA-splicing ligase RtcB
MQVIKKDNYRVPVFNWCEDLESEAWLQVDHLAQLPFTVYLAVMRDGHKGYGMPIGGVAAFDKTVIPNAVGVN